MEMHFMKERVGRMLECLEQQIYPLQIPIKEFRILPSGKQPEDIDPAGTSSWMTFRRGEIWGGDREYYLFETSVTIPEEMDGKCVVLEVCTGREGEWDATNPQFSIFVDGRRIQGLDVNHREIILSEEARTGQNYRITLSAYTGDHNYTLNLDARLKILDRLTQHYYYDLKVPYDTARLLNSEDQDYIEIIQALNNSLNILDMREEGSDAYYESLAAAQENITKCFYEKLCDPNKMPLICCVGHTHIDCAWLWTLAVTRDKAVRSFSTVLELMKQYPEYIFMSSQPQLYQYVKENAPDVYEGIKERVREGRWEPEGGMWVEPDCNLPSGESFCRQFLYGKRFFRKEFGKNCEILWLPDVFGYSAALPQIMKECGIHYFMTTKISWNETNRMPCDTFLWEGIDGTRILTHFISTRDYNKAAQENGTETEHFTTYNGFLNPSQMKGAWARYGNKDLNQEILCSYGFGDGGGGPTAEQLENQRRMEKGIPGLPRTRPSTALGFFRALEQQVSGSRYLPTWSGELYLEYHRGTYTSMGRNKRFNRKAEFACQNEETWALTDHILTGAEYPEKEMDDLWIIICRNQFHDILPGSAIKEVYEDSRKEYESLFLRQGELQERSLSDLADSVSAPEHSLVVFNPNSSEVPSIVSFRKPQGFRHVSVYDGEKKLPVQETEEGYICTASDVPSKGYRTFMLQDGMVPDIQDQDKSAQSLLTAETGHMENRWFLIQFNEKGQFSRLYDKTAGRDVFPKGQAGNVIVSYEDRPHNYDNWDINNYYKEKYWEVDDLSSLKVTECGPVRATIRLERRYLSSVIVQYISIYRDIPRIDIRNEIDWKQHMILLKDHFPIDVHAREATFEIQFGNVKRNTIDNTSWDWSKFEVCHHKWLDIAEDGYGVSFLNDCKYGVSVRGTDVGLTMLKSGMYPNPEADKEHHSFTYSIYPHTGDWRSAGTVGMAYSLNNPLVAVIKENTAGIPSRQLPAIFSLVSVDADNVVIDSVKKAQEQDAVIVRMYECYNRRSEVVLHSDCRIRKAYSCNILEEEEEPVPFAEHEIKLLMHPYEIRTMKFFLEQSE